MSTIKVTNIQDTSGGNQSTSEEIFQGRAKAWVNFNGENTVAIRDDFNVTSITDGGTANYTVNFTTDMSNANYAAVVSSLMTGSNSFAAYERIDNIATSSFQIRTVHSSSFQDISLVCAAVFGD